VTASTWAWQQQAACRGRPASIFFPARGDQVGLAVARRVCAGCPVRTECLAAALRLGDGFGVWGGLTGAERLELRRSTRER